MARNLTTDIKPNAFSPDYVTAKARFLEAAAHVGARLHSYPQDVGSSGESSPGDAPHTPEPSLTIDVAVVPGRTRERAVVISSGLHGVEGFFGSAVQLAWLRAVAEERVPRFDGTTVLIHALNPFGFSQLRRFDADNVDLNRNFLLPTERYAGAPDGYAELSPLLNPTQPSGRVEVFWWQALAAIRRHGLTKLKAVIAVGQYEFPRGLFFGGHQPATTAEIVQAHFSEWIGDARQVVHIDFHTGLGKWGRAKLLLIDPADSPKVAWYANHFGRDAVEPLASSSGTAYAAQGVMGAWLQAHLVDRDYRFFVAEFGTHNVLRVFAALRMENCAFHALEASDPRRIHAARELVECFCPASHRWRRRVLLRGLEVIREAQFAADHL